MQLKESREKERVNGRFLGLAKPQGIGMDSWRRMRKLLKRHAPGDRGVHCISDGDKLSKGGKENHHGDTVQSYDKSV